MGRFRGWLGRLQHEASKDLEGFELLDNSTYYYDRLETYKELFLHAYDVEIGDADKWPEPPEVYRKMCEAKNPAAVLERFRPENPQVAFVNLAELYDLGALVNERRLVPSEATLAKLPPENLSE
jgi:hypothetical protein